MWNIKNINVTKGKKSIKNIYLIFYLNTINFSVVLE